MILNVGYQNIIKNWLMDLQKKYNLTKLVYFEDTNSALSAIEREKQIKGWLRLKKIKLLEEMNPEWKDLSDGWYEDI